MAPDPGALPPIRRSIVVPTSPDDAFRLWTDDIGAWWPLDPHSVHGAGGTVAFVDGELVERGPSGEQCSWGSVLAWEPGARVQLTWHPGRTADEATEVEVRFEAVDVAGGGRGHTLVTIEHRGWERHPDGSAARSEYGRGWLGVLGRFGDAARADDVWLVLAHTAGPAAPIDGPLFAHPDFAEHVAFLDRLAGLSGTGGSRPPVAHRRRARRRSRHDRGTGAGGRRRPLRRPRPHRRPERGARPAGRDRLPLDRRPPLTAGPLTAGPAPAANSTRKPARRGSRTAHIRRGWPAGLA
ncbi:MAG: SRPBCC family protein [Acidimicrobiales bacterium]